MLSIICNSYDDHTEPEGEKSLGPAENHAFIVTLSLDFPLVFPCYPILFVSYTNGVIDYYHGNIDPNYLLFQIGGCLSSNIIGLIDQSGVVKYHRID